MKPEIIHVLSEQLRKPLPGFEAHKQMFPRGNAAADLLQVPETARKSAVAILLFEDAGILNSIVIKRSEYDGTHSGQIAFPGGKFEDTDEDLIQTALRECFEEIGIEPDELHHLGNLSDVYTVVSSFLISPHVFHWKRPHDGFKLSEREVAAVYRLSLNELIRNEAVQHFDVPVRNGLVLKAVPHFVVGEIRIWGATAVILSELKVILQSI